MGGGQVASVTTCKCFLFLRIYYMISRGPNGLVIPLERVPRRYTVMT